MSVFESELDQGYYRAGCFAQAGLSGPVRELYQRLQGPGMPAESNNSQSLEELPFGRQKFSAAE